MLQVEVLLRLTAWRVGSPVVRTPVPHLEREGPRAPQGWGARGSVCEPTPSRPAQRAGAPTRPKKKHISSSVRSP